MVKIGSSEKFTASKKKDLYPLHLKILGISPFQSESCIVRIDDIQHIPFKGSGQSVPSLIGGQVDMLFSALPSLSGFVKTGQVRLLGNNAAKRSTQEPNVQAIAEIIPGSLNKTVQPYPCPIEDFSLTSYFLRAGEKIEFPIQPDFIDLNIIY